MSQEIRDTIGVDEVKEIIKGFMPVIPKDSKMTDYQRSQADLILDIYGRLQIHKEGIKDGP
jgi:hypothetical protein